MVFKISKSFISFWSYIVINIIFSKFSILEAINLGIKSFISSLLNLLLFSLISFLTSLWIKLIKLSNNRVKNSVSIFNSVDFSLFNIFIIITLSLSFCVIKDAVGVGIGDTFFTVEAFLLLIIIAITIISKSDNNNIIFIYIFIQDFFIIIYLYYYSFEK